VVFLFILARIVIIGYMKKGFTLIELLVVVSIIGLLSSVVVTSLGSSRQRARIGSAQTALRGALGVAQLCDSVRSMLTSGSPNVAGGTSICQDTSVVGTFPRLPTGGSPAWSYDTNVDASGGDGAYQYRATGDGRTITCTAAGCQ